MNEQRETKCLTCSKERIAYIADSCLDIDELCGAIEAIFVTLLHKVCWRERLHLVLGAALEGMILQQLIRRLTT